MAKSSYYKPQAQKKDEKMIIGVDYAHASGKSRGVSFRCNAHTDKKKRDSKMACRNKGRSVREGW